MQVRRNRRTLTLTSRLPHTPRLTLELLEGRLPPGDLGLTGALLLGEWSPELSPSERRTAEPDRAVMLGSGLTASGRLELLSAVGALPAEYQAAATAPAAGAVATTAGSDLGDPLFNLAGGFGFEGGPGITDATMGVGPNTLANSRTTCPAAGQGRTQSEVSMAYEPFSGAVVVGYNDARGFGCPTQDQGYQVTGWSYSLDGGFTFTDGGPLPGRQSMRGDPWLATGPDGSIYFASLWNGLANLAVLRGTVAEDGIAWSNPTVIGGDGQYDKEAMTVDPYTGNIYVTYTRFGGPGGIWSVRSTDGGQTFERAVPVRSGSQPQLQGSFPTIGPNGEVMVAYNIGYPQNTGIGFAVSYDEGQSYYDLGQVGSITNFQIAGHNRGLHTDFPQIAVDTSGGPNTGNIYITWATQQGNTQGDVVMIRSSDYGATWSAPVTVNDDTTTGIQFFPTISVDANGFVNIAFYDRRENPGTAITNVYFAQSQDGGETFGANLKITEVPSTWNCCTDMTPNFGDYIHSLSVGPYVGVTWADARAGDPDAYMAWLYPLE